LVEYALSLTEVQRADRLVRAANNSRELAKELMHTGHTNWSPVEYPDWLLLEVESGILIRPAQARVASLMMNPPGDSNHVMQLDMGEGKSSVIVPMMAAHLADGSRLVRVIVAKAQSRQMMHTLTCALGGLLDRRVCRLPFSREFRFAQHETERIKSFCETCIADGSVILAQPEHILAFKLLSLEIFLRSGEPATATRLLTAQSFFDAVSRDIVDETDQNLSPKLEITYPIGSQQNLELGSSRWRLIHSVLGLVAEITQNIDQENLDKIAVASLHDGGFPRIRILDESGASLLSEMLVKQMLETGLPGFPFLMRQEGQVREAFGRFILLPQPVAGDDDTVQGALQDKYEYGLVLLLRGLLAHGILSFSLQKRWKVEYGRIHNRRPPTRLVVPYRAKDSPTPRSDFSHPDVLITLTCLAYYYDGLSNEELFEMLETLSRTTEGEDEYRSWMDSVPANMPSFCHSLGAIDTKDRDHCVDNVFPNLRYLKRAIDYYLSEIVFAKELREFPQRLSESGWSIAVTKSELTTGFSGTNDTKYLLPLGIKSLDTEQRHTNAAVICRLLGSDNEVREFGWAPDGAPVEDSQVHTGLELIDRIAQSTPPIRVIIDVGAQILELSSLEAARYWLSLVRPAEAGAVIYFDGDELSVVEREGTTQPFLSSSYVTNTGACLVFLDEAHTRSTDLRLPGDYRAAVTLGPGLTKDRLVQGMDSPRSSQVGCCG